MIPICRPESNPAIYWENVGNRSSYTITDRKTRAVSIKLSQHSLHCTICEADYIHIVYVHSCSKVMGFFFAMSKSGS